MGSKDIAGRARGFGMPAERCDGADFFAVYEAAGRLVTNARRGEGQSTLEATITRFYGHFEGDPQLYRAKDEVKRQRETMDCLKHFRQRHRRGLVAGRRAGRHRRAGAGGNRSGRRGGEVLAPAGGVRARNRRLHFL